MEDNDPGVEFETSKDFIHEDEAVLRVPVRRWNDRLLGPGWIAPGWNRRYGVAVVVPESHASVWPPRRTRLGTPEPGCVPKR